MVLRFVCGQNGRGVQLMRSKLSGFVPATIGGAKVVVVSLAAILLTALTAHAAPEAPGGEASLKLPDLSSVSFVGGINGHNLLLYGILACVFGLVFGLAIFMKLKNLPVHRAMREISELIY
jgi:K(+)-stimulated pyrophosphate-energized sodium pump